MPESRSPNHRRSFGIPRPLLVLSLVLLLPNCDGCNGEEDYGVEPSQPVNVTGTVTDTTTPATPVSDARIVARSNPEAPVAATATTNSAGNYQLTVSSKDDYVLNVAARTGLMSFTDTGWVNLPFNQDTARHFSARDGSGLALVAPVGDITVAPGATVSLPTLDWQLWGSDDCPDCNHWMVVGADAQPGDTLRVNAPQVYPGVTGSAGLQLTAPAVSGSYQIYGFRTPAADGDPSAAYAAAHGDADRRTTELIPLGTLTVMDPSGGSTVTWVGGGADSLWTTPANWDVARVPGPGDDVVIPANARPIHEPASFTDTTAIRSLMIATAAVLDHRNGTLLLADTSSVAGRLSAVVTTGSPALALESHLEVTGELEWAGVTITGGTIALAPGSAAQVGNAEPSFPLSGTLDGTALEVGGRLTVGEIPSVARNGKLFLNGASVSVLAGGEMWIQPWAEIEGDASSTVDNAGLIRGQTGGPIRIDADFANTGQIDALDGVGIAVTPGRSATNEGTITTLTALDVGDLTLMPSSSVTADVIRVYGALEVAGTLTATDVSVGVNASGNGASITLAGDAADYSIGRLTVGGSGVVASAVVAMSDTLELDRLGLVDSDLDVQGQAVLIREALTLLRGRITGTGTTLVESTNPATSPALVTFSGGATDTTRIDAHTIIGRDGIRWLGGAVVAGNGAVLENHTEFDILVPTDGAFDGGLLGGTILTLANYGTIRKSSGTGTVTIDACVDPDGTVVEDSGTLVINDSC